jgi:hypothetical protein
LAGSLMHAVTASPLMPVSAAHFASIFVGYLRRGAREI